MIDILKMRAEVKKGNLEFYLQDCNIYCRDTESQEVVMVAEGALYPQLGVVVGNMKIAKELGIYMGEEEKDDETDTAKNTRGTRHPCGKADADKASGEAGGGVGF